MSESDVILTRGLQSKLTPLEVTQLRVRAAAVEELCKQFRSETPVESPAALTNRGWLAQSVLNILSGYVDDQLLNPNPEV